MKKIRNLGPFFLATTAFTSPVAAQDIELSDRLLALEERIEALANENADLRAELELIKAEALVGVEQTAAAEEPGGLVQKRENFNDSIGTNSAYAFRVLDQSVDVNTKPIVQLKALRDEQLNDRITLSGQITAIANYQWSNRDDKFGYLMRNPTSANQIGDKVSEAVLHSANLAMTARLSDDLLGYAELLYNPEQNFGPGTITSRDRNQIQLRRGWIMWGNLDKSPIYGLIGKMDVPFGLNDSVSPFTNSTNWHAFAPLAYGAQLGFYASGLSVRAMAVQGGAQFRSANAPVRGTAVPSRLNNFVFDGNYQIPLGMGADNVRIGASYQHATSYCQGYPVFHFNPCEERNPGIAAYGVVNFGQLKLLGEYAQTTKAWPGSNVPIPNNPLSVFPAVKTKAFTIGGRYSFGETVDVEQHRKFAFSGEFSKFIAGAEDSPWERQNQAVLGFSYFPFAHVNIFSEFIHVDGFAPLNFVSGGNFPDGSTWSDREAATNVILVGATAAF